MRIIILLLIIGFSFACAKYIPQQRGDSELIFRSKRSDSDESVASIDRDSTESNDSDSDNADALFENQRLEEQVKLCEKEERLRLKLLEKQEKQRRKNEEKFAKEARKEQERIEKEERKRQERVEKEKRKKEAEEIKIQEKLRKEQLKRQEKQQKELNKLQKEILEQSNEDDFLETEEESSVELEDIWRNHIYVKYGLTFASTKLEKQAALDRYLQEELGLSPNSTVSERRQAIMKLIQTKLETDPALRESLKNQILSQVNAVALQNLQTKLENDILELDNKTELLNNVSLPWATQVQEKLTGTKNFLQFLSGLLSNWTSNEQTPNLTLESNINTTTSNDVNDLPSSGTNVTSNNQPSTTGDNFMPKSSGTTKDIPLLNAENNNELNTNNNTGNVASVSVTEDSSVSTSKPENSDASAIPTDGNNITSPMITDTIQSKENGIVNIIIKTDATTINDLASVTDNIGMVDVTILSVLVSDITEAPATKNETSSLPETVASETNGSGNVNVLNPNENKHSDTTITDTVTNNIENGKSVSELVSDATPTPSADSVITNTNESESGIFLPNDLDNSVTNASINNNLESTVNQTTENVAPANSDRLSIDSDNLGNNPSINNNGESNIIQITTENAEPTNNIYSPTDVESSLNKENVANEDNIGLTETAVDVTQVTVPSTNTNPTDYIDSSSAQNAIVSSVTNINKTTDGLENDLNGESNIATESSIAIVNSNTNGNSSSAIANNISGTNMSESTISGDNTSSPSTMTDPGNAVSNNIVENVINLDNVISTESSGIVITDVPNITSGLNILNTDVVTLTNIDVVSTSSPIALDTNNYENEVKVSTTGDETNISTLSVNIISDSTFETATVSGTAISPNDTMTASTGNATVAGTGLNSVSSTNAPEITENLVTEAVQPNSIPTDLLTTKVDITTEPQVSDPSSIAIPVSENIADTTNLVITTEINPIDGIIVPVEPGAAVVEITSQT